MSELRSSISAATSVVGVIGDPVAHSLSPRLHNAAFAVLGIDWISIGIHTAAADISDAVNGIRAMDIKGLSVTMPHKSAVAALVNRCTPMAERLSSVNCIVNQNGVLVGHSTDGPGLLAALSREANFDASGKRCLVVGAGGAARAVVVALADAGAIEVVVVNRTESRATSTALLAPGVGRVGVAKDATTCDLVVNATPAGMGDDQSWALDPTLVGVGQLVVDLVYFPPLSPWLAAAQARGAVTVNGLGMLVHQAALQIELWINAEAPVDAMWRAVALTPPG